MNGVYILLIKISKDITIKAGSLGKICLKKGLYTYIGSAQKNIDSRITRHLSKNKKFHWHIDYLLANKHSKIEKICIMNQKKSFECRLAKKFMKNSIPVKKFGSSDCRCMSHLFKTEKKTFIKNKCLI